MKADRFVSMAVVTILILCTVTIHFERQQVDYIYLDGQYYALTSERLDIRGGMRGETVGTITQNAPVLSRQHEGDSNALPLGTQVYAICTEGLSYDKVLHYRNALTYFADGRDLVVRMYFKQIPRKEVP